MRRLASLIVERAVRALLDELSLRERAEGGEGALPGWQLVEHDPDDPDRHRRVRLDADQVLHRPSTDT